MQRSYHRQRRDADAWGATHVHASIASITTQKRCINSHRDHDCQHSFLHWSVIRKPRGINHECCGGQGRRHTHSTQQMSGASKHQLPNPPTKTHSQVPSRARMGRSTGVCIEGWDKAHGEMPFQKKKQPRTGQPRTIGGLAVWPSPPLVRRTDWRHARAKRRAAAAAGKMCTGETLGLQAENGAQRLLQVAKRQLQQPAGMHEKCTKAAAAPVAKLCCRSSGRFCHA